MRRNYFTIIPVLLFSLLALSCGKQEPAPGNVNATPTASAPVPGSALAPPPALVGEYILSEVQHNGQVTMISTANSTEISFRPDGTYARVSRIGGKVDHSDSGAFRTEGGKQLVLRINMWKKKFQQRPVEKTHSYSLSSDGSELQLIGKDGKIAVFRRTKVLAAN